MEKKRDLRIQKTYDSLIQAFQELLQEKSFEKITVRELCDRAKTRTATFYSHFNDKYDFFAFMVRELRGKLAGSVDIVYDRADPADYFASLLRVGIDFLEQNKGLALSVRNDRMLVTMVQTVSEDITEELEKHLNLNTKTGDSIDDHKLMVQFLIGAMNQVVVEWFFNQKGRDKEAVIRNTTKLVQKVIC